MFFHRLIIVCFCFYFGISLAAQLKHPFKQCSPRSAGEVLDVSVSGQCQSDYCVFVKNTTARLQFSFTLRKKASKLRAKVIATVGTVDHHFPLAQHNVCQHLGGCPLNINTRYSYENSMFLSSKYPSIKVNQLRYFLIDGKGREVICVSLPVMITEK